MTLLLFIHLKKFYISLLLLLHFAPYMLPIIVFITVWDKEKVDHFIINHHIVLC